MLANVVPDIHPGVSYALVVRFRTRLFSIL